MNGSEVYLKFETWWHQDSFYGMEAKPVQKPHIPIYLGGYSPKTFARIASHANGWVCTIRHSLDQLKLNIDKIKEECRKVRRDPKDINIAAILYPNIIDSGYTEKKYDEKDQQKSSKLLTGDIDQIGNDLREINEIGVNHAILNYNRSEIGDNIDSMIDVSKKLNRISNSSY
jgi:alkanesulfonate monooxygenase SsuD/methylene tetrahydromethanopterin reductase-like flavin-dependent oxidoreductase (luciferase family)